MQYQIASCNPRISIGLLYKSSTPTAYNQIWRKTSEITEKQIQAISTSVNIFAN